MHRLSAQAYRPSGSVPLCRAMQEEHERSELCRTALHVQPVHDEQSCQRQRQGKEEIHHQAR